MIDIEKLVHELANDCSKNPYPNDRSCTGCLCTIREGCELAQKWEEPRKSARLILELAKKKEA